MTITPEALVAREVHYCVSYLVSTLAAGSGAMSYGNSLDSTETGNLIEQAFELASSIDDWEEAARQEGYAGPFGADVTFFKLDDAHGGGVAHADSWQELCEQFDIEPYQRDVYEHWIVSDWLADRLAEKGEKVDKDFAGMTVWARTTTGQGIASDGVIEAICAELNK